MDGWVGERERESERESERECVREREKHRVSSVAVQALRLVSGWVGERERVRESEREGKRERERERETSSLFCYCITQTSWCTRQEQPPTTWWSTGQVAGTASISTTRRDY